MAKGRVIKINALNEAVAKVLEEYGEYVSEGVAEKAFEAGAKWAAERLRSVSPRRTGAYAGSWDYEKSYSKSKGTKIGYTVFSNSPYYRLTSWVENGHATRNGGRTKAQPHIKSVEEDVGEQVVNEIKAAIK